MMRAALLLTLLTSVATQPPTTEVRQLVSFRFLPGSSAEAIALFRDEALPLYEDNAPMIRFRGYREAESPTPLDLLVVSTFAGMEGMDASNDALRKAAEARGTSVGSIYGRIGALSREHRDEFVEIDPELSWGSLEGAALVVVTAHRVVPGGREDYELLVRRRLMVLEREDVEGLTGAEGGAFLVSDGWHYVRFIGLQSLGQWHDYVRARRDASWFTDYDHTVALSRQHILVPLPELSVR